jgi:hypothetical protein
MAARAGPGADIQYAESGGKKGSKKGGRDYTLRAEQSGIADYNGMELFVKAVTACKVHSGNPILVSPVYLTNTVFPRNEVMRSFQCFASIIVEEICTELLNNNQFLHATPGGPGQVCWLRQMMNCSREIARRDGSRTNCRVWMKHSKHAKRIITHRGPG